MYACLIRHFKGDSKVREDTAHSDLNLLLCRHAQIVGVKVEQIVVLDPRAGSSSRLKVPDGLEQTPGDEPGVREPKLLPPRENGRIHRIARDVTQKGRRHRAQRLN